MKRIANFFKDESGLELSEYAIAAALIAIGAATAFTALGSKVKDAIDALVAKIVVP